MSKVYELNRKEVNTRYVDTAGNIVELTEQQKLLYTLFKPAEGIEKITDIKITHICYFTGAQKNVDKFVYEMADKYNIPYDEITLKVLNIININ